MHILEEGRQQRFRILVADDEPGILELFGEILEPGGSGPAPEPGCGSGGWSACPPGFETSLHDRAEDAVGAVRESLAMGHPFSVAFLDVRMGKRDGIWAAEQIRGLDPLIQIVIISAYTDLDPADLGTRVPPADRLLFLQKPFHPREILQLATSLGAKWQTELRNQFLQGDLMALVGDKTDELAAANEKLRQDMLESEKTQKMVVRAKMEWEATFDSVQDLIVIFDPELRVRRVNKAMASRLGFHPRNVVGLECGEVFDRPERPGEVSDRVRDLADRRFHAEELTIPRLAGDFLVTASPFLFQDGEIVGTVIVAHDITRHKILEAELRQAQKMEAIGTLAGGIAHDFNNILGIIMGYTEMILDTPRDGFPSQADQSQGQSLDRRLRQILQAGHRARDLVLQILTFSRQGDQELRPLHISPLVKEIMKLMRSTLPANITVRQSLGCGTGGDWAEDIVLAEPTQIQQIVMNLCTNSAHAMRETGGTLEVDLTPADLDQETASAHPQLAPGPYIRLTVRDTGHGMPPEVVERIFDPFFTTKRTGEGTGMGLSVVHGIVQRHGGAILVSSEPGRGSTFQVLLPRAVPKAGSDLGPNDFGEAEGALPRGLGHILFVDDERALVEIGAETLHSLGYRVTASTDSLEALGLFSMDPSGFDLLVTDQTMPHLSGVGLARRILALRPGFPIVLCTGFSETVSAEEAKAAGIRELVLKPLLKRKLAESVRRALSKSHDSAPGPA